MLRGETKEVQNSYSWSSQRGKSHKIRAFLKKEKKKNLHENTLPYSKIIPASGYLIGQKLFLLLKRASTVWKRRVSVLVSMQLVLMTVPFPPVFAVVHPPVKQTEPYEAQECSLLFKTWFKNQASFSVSHSSLPTQKGKWRGKHQLEEPEKTANILWCHHWFFPQNDVWEMSAEIQYWWGITTKNWVVFLMVNQRLVAWLIISTTQIWVVTHHQYGISAHVPLTSFHGETTGSIAIWADFSSLV